MRPCQSSKNAISVRQCTSACESDRLWRARVASAVDCVANQSAAADPELLVVRASVASRGSAGASLLSTDMSRLRSLALAAARASEAGSVALATVEGPVSRSSALAGPAQARGVSNVVAPSWVRPHPALQAAEAAGPSQADVARVSAASLAPRSPICYPRGSVEDMNIASAAFTRADGDRDDHVPVGTSAAGRRHPGDDRCARCAVSANCRTLTLLHDRCSGAILDNLHIQLRFCHHMRLSAEMRRGRALHWAAVTHSD